MGEAIEEKIRDAEDDMVWVVEDGYCWGKRKKTDRGCPVMGSSRYGRGDQPTDRISHFTPLITGSVYIAFPIPIINSNKKQNPL